MANDNHPDDALLTRWAEDDYAFGFVSNIEQDIDPKGLNTDVVRLISARKEEPEWLLEWRLKAFDYWQKNAFARLGPFGDSPHRLPGYFVLRRSQSRQKTGIPGRIGS